MQKQYKHDNNSYNWYNFSYKLQNFNHDKTNISISSTLHLSCFCESAKNFLF